MADDRWATIQELFHAAADLPRAEQRAQLEKRAGGDAALVADVLALLEEDARGSSLLDASLATVAAEVVADPDGRLPAGAFGPYRVRGLLGEGGMGVVYLAEREDIGSLVAIKLLRDAWLSPARRERFASEQRTLAQLDHPGIARIYDASTLADGTPWFVLEYVDGERLTDFCSTRALSVRQRLQLFRNVCEAVAYAHRHAIIHRDLKPSNILVRADATPKLLDFGIAKRLADGIDSDHTRTGLRLMTPAYASPEQIRGEPVSAHADVYALGVILYELLTGRLPFDLSDRTPGEAERILIEEEPTRPSVAAHIENGSAVSASASQWADLDVLVLTAMHKDPARRYGSVDALVRDVDHYLQAQPLDARPDSLRYRAGKFVARNRRAVVAASLVALGAVGMLAYHTVRLTGARDEAVAEAARAQRIERFLFNLFEGGDEATGPADSLRVVTLVDRGLQEARSLAAEPGVQAELYLTLGGIYQKLGNLPRADTLMQTALEMQRSHAGTESGDLVRGTIALALLRLDQADLEEAESLSRDALARARSVLGSEHPTTARATAALGQVLEEKGDYAESIDLLEEAARVFRADSPESAELAGALTELANSHYYAGDLNKSDSLNRVVLEMDRRMYGDRHPSIANDLINLGAIMHERGEYVAAEQPFRQALDITEGWFGPEHYRTASNLTLLGRTLLYQGRLAEAESTLSRALAIQERVYGAEHPRVASTVNELGSIALQMGNYDEAEQRYIRMTNIYASVHGKAHPFYATGRSNLGSVYSRREDWVRAEGALREAVSIYAAAQGAEHLNVGIGRIKLGRALLRQKRYQEAERETLSGFEIVSAQASPTVSWLKSARTDLAEIYQALGDTLKAAKYRDTTSVGG